MLLAEIAERIGARLEGDGTIEIRGLAPIEAAAEGELSFVANQRYASKLASHRASAVIVGRDAVSPHGATLRADDPYLAFVRALELFDRPLRPEPGVHPTAVVDPSARIGARAAIGPLAVVGARVVLGDDARLDARVVIYPDVIVGDGFVAHSGAVVRERVRIGHRVKLQAGAVVGGDGFGYVFDPNEGRIRPIPQTGNVVLEDDVEVGCNTTIDRATIGTTRIRQGAKLDNLVMIAHGCDVGENVFLASQVGLSGSTRVGAFAQLGGQVGAAGHLTIGEGARIAAQSGVPNDVPAGATVGSGMPAWEVGLYRRIVAALTRLPELLRRVRRLEQAAGIASEKSKAEP